MYNGTLGLKHDSALLLTLAQACESEQKVRLVIISEGDKMDALSRQAHQAGYKHTILLPFQSEKDFPLALACADVTLAILTDDAARFSVPSKILNYMCSGSPTLISANEDNQAVQCILQANAGLAVAAGNTAWAGQTGLDRYSAGVRSIQIQLVHCQRWRPGISPYPAR